jgi:hypothetical protein
MTNDRSNTEQPGDPDPSRRYLYRFVYSGITAGLPAPRGVRFHGASVFIEFDDIADLRKWEGTFGVTFDRNEQPYPITENPADAEQWSVTARADWAGWKLTLSALDPITEDQRRDWFDSPHGRHYVAYLAHKREAGEQP